MCVMLGAEYVKEFKSWYDEASKVWNQVEKERDERNPNRKKLAEIISESNNKFTANGVTIENPMDVINNTKSKKKKSDKKVEIN